MERRRILVVAAALVACLGVALVLLYVRGADQRAQAAYATTKVLVATSTIAPGESMQEAANAGKVRLEDIVSNAVLPGAQSSTEALSDEVATTTIYRGEQIISAKFGMTVAAPSTLPIPAGMTAVTMNLSDSGRVAGFVAPGSEVSVFLAYNDPASGKPYTRILIPKVQVLGVGSTAAVTPSSDGSSTSTAAPVPDTLLTLGVTQDDAAKVIFGQQNGMLSVSLLTQDSKPATASGPVTFDTVFR